jgi:cell division transport system permease protein
MILSFARILKFSFQDIARNIWLSIVTMIILILALFTVNMLLVVKVVGQTATDAVRQKIDVNLFLKVDSTEDKILALKSKISNFNEVKEVRYISQDDALKEFKEKHADNPQILEALNELGENPLAPSLIIKPTNLDAFDNLVSQLNTIDSNIIESRNFTNYKLMIDKINGITDKVSEAGMILSLIFIFISILVIYNSVRVAIYTHRREITIMRLVGASNGFVQMPYLLSSIFYAFISTLFVMAVFYPFLTLLQPYLETFFVGYNVNLLNYFLENMLAIFGAQFLVTSTIGVVASFLAVNKYSKV